MAGSCGAAFIDANVMVRAWTMDVMLSLAEAGMFEPLWSKFVLDEAHEALLGLRPQAESQIVSYLSAVQRSNSYACVPESEFAVVVPDLPDPDDGHVVAAAAGGGAKWVVTYNLRDFPAGILAPLGLKPILPDAFLCMLFSCDGSLAVATMRRLGADKRRPPRTMAEELAGLRRNGLANFAAALEEAFAEEAGAERGGAS